MWLAERRIWLPVLLYHRVGSPPVHDPWRNFVTPRAFESHLRWLRASGYRGVSLRSVADALQGGTRLPRRAVAITFDDGYRDTYTHAFPLLRRYGYGAAIFLVSDAVGGQSSFDAGSGYEPAPLLGRAEILEMAAAGIEFGSHTRTHPASLADLEDESLHSEVEGSRRTLQELLDRPIDLFAYPHSQLDSRVERAVATAGYRLACAGVGTRFDRLCACRVAPPQSGGPAVDIVASWRRLKWRSRSLLSALQRWAA